MTGTAQPAAKLSVSTTAMSLRASVPASGGGGNQTLSEILTSAGVTPAADGQYTVGLGVTRDGKITIQSGIITAVQTALP